jgi:two-component system NtrC family sensor kinase
LGEVELNRVVSSVVDGQAERLGRAGIEVEVRLSRDEPCATGDAHRLEQLLINLLTNAEDALSERPGPRRIVVGTLASEDGPSLFVQDNGPGIAPENRGRIFEPFFTTKPVGQGTGLGLSLCYGIVREHDGRIEAGDVPGGGACFRVTLRPPEPARDEPAAESARDTRGVPSRSLAILVVDDDAAVADLIRDALTLAGHRVATAANGRRALERLAESRFDVVLSDLRMPEMDGIGLHGEIARLWPHLLERIVFITGDQAGDATREFLARTGAPCLGKPFSLTELESCLDVALAENAPPTPRGPTR